MARKIVKRVNLALTLEQANQLEFLTAHYGENISRVYANALYIYYTITNANPDALHNIFSPKTHGNENDA
jgi:hypothetical protein